ncbi:hypothetical protein BCR44DRAFT_1501936 [Catenaria anguillulae PL171]|uniref:USP domain-containing protein n=1 Tax=Catenaria anguillulae PL171 TaxID=765915 RepID=A0A1Y2HDA5_9FUNG|nr:hypothetical protein BCR44DRAFT_1501936 [Catenaria anguillulae PL171]
MSSNPPLLSAGPSASTQSTIATLLPSGIENQRNECFAIAVVQVLLQCQPFTNWLTLFTGYTRKYNASSQLFPVAAALSSLFDAMSPPCVNPTLPTISPLMCAIRKYHPWARADIPDGQQSDAAIFLGILLHCLFVEAEATFPTRPVIANFLYSMYKTDFDATHNGVILLDISHHKVTTFEKALQLSLKWSYTYCPPDMLFMSVNRNHLEIQKIRKHVNVPTMLNLSNYFDSAVGTNDAMYRRSGVVYHSGATFWHGHCTAHVRLSHALERDVWMYTNDRSCRHERDSACIAAAGAGRDTVLVAYEKVDEHLLEVDEFPEPLPRMLPDEIMAFSDQDGEGAATGGSGETGEDEDGEHAMTETDASEDEDESPPPAPAPPRKLTANQHKRLRKKMKRIGFAHIPGLTDMKFLGALHDLDREQLCLLLARISAPPIAARRQGLKRTQQPWRNRHRIRSPALSLAQALALEFRRHVTQQPNLMLTITR